MVIYLVTSYSFSQINQQLCFKLYNVVLCILLINNIIIFVMNAFIKASFPVVINPILQVAPTLINFIIVLMYVTVLFVMM